MKKFPPDGHPYFKPPYEKPDKEHVWVLWVAIAFICFAPIIAAMWSGQ